MNIEDKVKDVLELMHDKYLSIKAMIMESLGISDTAFMFILFLLVIVLFLLGFILTTSKKKIVSSERDVDFEETVSEVPLPIMTSAKKTGEKRSKKATLTKHIQEEIMPMHEVQQQKKHILVVDDSKLMLETLNKKLSKTYRLTLANNAFEALDVVFSHDRPDLVLSDIEMPDDEHGNPGSGLALLETLQKSVIYSNIPVILMTANLEIAAERGFELGAKGFLSKPLADDIMFSQIEYCLNE